jgi:hypothetical protein
MIDRYARVCLSLLAFAAACPAAVYEVGASATYPTLASLPSLAPGDIVEINPGTYNETMRWTDAGTSANPIIIRGVGTARPVIDASGLAVDGALPNPRAAFQVEASNIIIQHLELINARNGNNGAAIRVTSTGATTVNVLIEDCRLDACDMGFMNDTCDAITLLGCEIDDNGTSANSGYSHNLYLNGGSTTIQGCSIHDALYGQNVKSRGHDTALLYNWIANSQDGEIGLVDEAATTGIANSNAIILGNIIISKDRGAGWNDERFILFGQDLGTAHIGTAYVINNTCIAGVASNSFLWSNWPAAAIVAENNIFVGSDSIAYSGSTGPISGTANWMPSGATIPAPFSASVTGSDPGFVNAGALVFTLTQNAAARGIGLASPTFSNGNGNTQSAIPTLTYQGLGMLTPRINPSGGLDAGAYAYAAITGVPAVAIMSPGSGAVYAAPAAITLTALAYETGGSVTSVSFSQGTTLLGTATTAPYTLSWTGVTAGSYSVTATATDSLGAVSTSAAALVTVTAAQSVAPVVAITAPLTATTVAAPATITIQANASEAGGTIQRVDFYDGSTLIGSAATAPYAVVWSSVPAGTYALMAIATDGSGTATSSATVAVTVTAAPTSGTAPPAVGSSPTTSSASGGSSHCGLGSGVAALLISLVLAGGRVLLLTVSSRVSARV